MVFLSYFPSWATFSAEVVSSARTRFRTPLEQRPFKRSFSACSHVPLVYSDFNQGDHLDSTCFHLAARLPSPCTTIPSFQISHPSARGAHVPEPGQSGSDTPQNGAAEPGAPGLAFRRRHRRKADFAASMCDFPLSLPFSGAVRGKQS